MAAISRWRLSSMKDAVSYTHLDVNKRQPWPEGDDDLPTDAQSTTVVTVLQPGYRAGEQVLRPARVAVADPA